METLVGILKEAGLSEKDILKVMRPEIQKRIEQLMVERRNGDWRKSLNENQRSTLPASPHAAF